MDTAKIGLITLGHEPYWKQFPGLKEELMGKTVRVKELVKEVSQVVDCGFIDTVSASYDSIVMLKKNDVDAIYIILSTYLTSSLVAPFAIYLDIPIILIALQPLKRLDYKNTTTYTQLYNDDICALPEICGVMERLNHSPLDCIVGTLYDDLAAENEMKNWCVALNAVSAFKYSKIGYLGHTYEGMYDMHTDPTAFTRTFKSHVEMLEMCELVDLEKRVSKNELNKKIEEINSLFVCASPSYEPLTNDILQEDIDIAASVSVALDKLIENHNLKGLAYFYVGANNEYEKISANLIIGNTLLTSKGIPLAGEADLKTCAALMIMNRIGGGGSFAELHPFDSVDDIVLIGHDGPHNINISNGKPILRKLEKFHGKEGSGLSVEFSLKTGPITLLSIGINSGGEFKFIIAEGESIEGEIPATGNTNTRCNFNCNVKDFIRKWSMAGSTHHLALGIGHHEKVISKVAKILDIEVIKINEVLNKNV